MYYLFVTDSGLSQQINAHAIFANNETNLANVDIYGFDYDYTLACYTSELHKLIYDLGNKELVHKYQVLTKCFKF